MNCRRLNITLFVEWRSRDDPFLVHADFGSRMFDQSSYSLDYDSFMAMVEFFNFHLDVDGFADHWNRKCISYYTRFPDPHCSAVNFFAQKLDQNLSYYCFPPPSMVTATILHMHAFNAHGLLLLPVWKSAAFWSNIVPDGQHFPPWVSRFLLFRPSSFVVDPNVLSHTFRCKPVTFDMLALLVDFRCCNKENMFTSLAIKENCLDYGCYMCYLSL